jgi:hypothetical protein
MPHTLVGVTVAGEVLAPGPALGTMVGVLRLPAWRRFLYTDLQIASSPPPTVGGRRSSSEQIWDWTGASGVSQSRRASGVRYGSRGPAVAQGRGRLACGSC